MLTAGPETDLAVAKACGIPLDVYEGTGNASTPALWHNGDPWNPSTDLNDAFLAAEKFGLFHNIQLMLSQSLRAEWGIFCYSEDPHYYTLEKTPALAICAAILKLAEPKDGQ